MVFGLFKKKDKKEKKANNSDSSRYFNMTIREVVKMTDDAVNLVFENPGSDFHYEPGQFLTIIQTIDGKKVRRAYSLCSTPAADEYPAVTVKRVEGGIMSNHVNDNLKAGDVIEIMEPMGHFTTEFDREQERHVVVFGGGSGITPLLSILKTVLIKEPKSRVSLVYANRNIESIIFKNELEEMEKEYEDRLTIIHSLDTPPQGWEGPSGVLTNEKLKGIIDSLPTGTSKMEYFTCGPEPMMDIVINTLDEIGIPADIRHKESFVASHTSDEEVSADSSVGTVNVKIILDGEEHEIEVPAGKPILEAALDADLDMPYSCQSGLCTACRAKCLSGKV